MDITLKLSKDFERCLEDLKKKYGEDFEYINGVHPSQLDFSEFIDNFVDKDTLADALDTGDICECCGARLTEKPWTRHYCLCSRCAEKLDYRCQKTWRYKEDRLWQSNDFLTREMNRRL